MSASTDEVVRLADMLASHRRALAGAAIESAALELCAEHPLQEVSVEQIAAASGVSVRTFYRYFPTKEEILAAFPLRRAIRTADALARRPPDEAPFEALRNAIAGLATDTDGELRRWQRAVANSHASERMEQLAMAVTAPVLAEAIAARLSRSASDLWPAVAGAAASSAMVIGAKRWAQRGGSLNKHMLGALEILGRGLDAPPV